MVVFKTNITGSQLVSCENVSEPSYCSRYLYHEGPGFSSDQEVVATVSPSGSISSLAANLTFPADESIVNCRPLQLEMRFGKYVVRHSFPACSNLTHPNAQISRTSIVKLTVHPTLFQTPKRMFPVFLPSGSGVKNRHQQWISK